MIILVKNLLYDMNMEFNPFIKLIPCFRLANFENNDVALKILM